MQSTISKWGNSLALRLPRHITEEANLTDGSSVNVEVEDGAIRITPARKRFLLSELLEGEPQRDHNEHEIDWGKPKGIEVW